MLTTFTYNRLTNPVLATSTKTSKAVVAPALPLRICRSTPQVVSNSSLKLPLKFGNSNQRASSSSSIDQFNAKAAKKLQIDQLNTKAAKQFSRERRREALTPFKHFPPEPKPKTSQSTVTSAQTLKSLPTRTLINRYLSHVNTNQPSVAGPNPLLNVRINSQRVVTRPNSSTELLANKANGIVSKARNDLGNTNQGR